MKVLMLNYSDLSGGAARAAFRIHKAILKSGIDSRMLVKNKVSNDETIVSLDLFKPKNKLYTVSNYIVQKLKNKIQHHRWRKYPDRDDVFLSDLRSVSLHGALHKLEYDILHVHWINLRFVDIKELTQIKKPIVWTLHDCWPFTGICHYFYDCERYKSKCGDCPFLHSGKKDDLSYQVWKAKSKVYPLLNLHILTPSRWLAITAHQSALLSKFPVTVIPNCIDTEVFIPGNLSEAHHYLGLNNNKKYILYGALNGINDRNKGFDLLIKALATLENEVEFSEFELLLLGYEESLYPIKTKIPYRNLGVLRTDKDLVFAYQAADVLVVPSLSENLSNTILEGMACGKPVIAFDTGGNSDLIDHKSNGYLASPFDCSDFAKGISWCLEHNKGNILSKAAREKVEERFTIENISRMYTNFYKKVKDEVMDYKKTSKKGK